MIKRITKFTGLLVSVASIISIIPAYAADVQKLDAQTGTIDSATAKGNGIFIDGEINGEDETVYWLSDDGKYNKLNVDTGSSLTGELFNQYLEIDTGAKDLTYLDIKNNYNEVDYDVREDLESTVARTIKAKLRHDDNGRFDKTTLESGDFTSLYNREFTIAPTKGTVRVGFLDGANGLSSFQVPLKDKFTPNGTTNFTYFNSYSSSSSTGNLANTSAIYGDATGNYVDADYNLGSLKIYADSTTGASVTLKNTDDSYNITKDGQTYQLKAVLQEKKYINDFSDSVERLAYLTIYKKGPNDTSYTKVTADDGFIFGGGKSKYTVDGTTTVVQEFSKTPASDTVEGIKYPKDSTIYFIADKDGNKDYLIGDSIASATQKLGTGITTTAGHYAIKVTSNDKAISSIYLDKDNNVIYTEAGTFEHKNSFNYVDISDYDKSDTDSTANGITYAGGVPYFVNSGYIETWDGDHSFIKFAKIDSGISGISVGSKNKIIVWDQDKEVYSIINVKTVTTTIGTTTSAITGISTTATTTGAAVTVSTVAATGWIKNGDNAWSYLENGNKKTGWLKDGSTWYYINSNGIMATGWVNDNGTWYYLDSSGAMLFDTTIDGYTLGSDGAWIG
jgi:hypothetical protein